MELLAVSRFYGVSPMEVNHWPHPLFLDASEYMELVLEVDARAAKGPPKEG